MKKGLIVLIVLCAAMLVSGTAFAAVQGSCADCHTMHNSLAANPMAGDNTGWNASGVMNGAGGPYQNLLRNDCVGCHTSASASTLITVSGGNIVPIVRNLVAPTTPLAGGNFYYVESVGEQKGHNLFTQDTRFVAACTNSGGLTYRCAPGIADEVASSVITGMGGHCNNSCHETLVNPTRSNKTILGCQGCHLETFHHKAPGTFAQMNMYVPNIGDTYSTASYNSSTNKTKEKLVDPTYRYLTGHHLFPRIINATDGTPYNGEVIAERSGPSFVEGVEDSDWEYTRSSADHNVYLAYTTTPGIINGTNHAMSALCAACHGKFHEEQKNSGGAWIRHPVDVLLKRGGFSEYSAYDYMNAYNVNAPVAFTVPTAPADGQGAVFCLSCHRPHGSPYDSMLRWDYTQIKAGQGDGTAGNCLTCHTKKGL